MKKLLLLGGSRYILPVIEEAHALGCEVITCDYCPDNIAHRYSDGYYNVSIIDKEAVLKLSRRLHINGIMSFACDPGVVTAAYVAERLDLPTCGPYKSVCILQNKELFRIFLREHGFRVPHAKGYNRTGDILEDSRMFRWPVMVKPVDSAGSKGVSRAEHVDELESCVRNALHFSKDGGVIVEDYLKSIGHPSDSECFSVDGDLKFVSYSAQRFDAFCKNPYTPAAFSWPSKISEENQKELTHELQRLLCLLDMGTSLYNVETRECVDGKAYIMECSPRGGGNRLAEMIRYSTGVDLISNAVRSAVGEPVVGIVQRTCDGCWAEIIVHSRKCGVFRNVRIADDITDEIVEKDIWIKEGDRIDDFTGADKAVGTLVMKFTTEEKMNEVLDHQERYVQTDVSDF